MYCPDYARAVRVCLWKQQKPKAAKSSDAKAFLPTEREMQSRLPGFTPQCPSAQNKTEYVRYRDPREFRRRNSINVARCGVYIWKETGISARSLLIAYVRVYLRSTKRYLICIVIVAWRVRCVINACVRRDFLIHGKTKLPEMYWNPLYVREIGT
jgi:hypothetical protein